jgi:hypothetical protein
MAAEAEGVEGREWIEQSRKEVEEDEEDVPLWL